MGIIFRGIILSKNTKKLLIGGRVLKNYSSTFSCRDNAEICTENALLLYGAVAFFRQ